jgi:hypothetical protein
MFRLPLRVARAMATEAAFQHASRSLIHETETFLAGVEVAISTAAAELVAETDAHLAR